MSLKIGDYIRNLHTGDAGFIISIEHDFAQVRMESDGDVYPMPIESLVLYANFFGVVAMDKDLEKQKKKKHNTTNPPPAPSPMASGNQRQVPVGSVLTKGSPSDSGLYFGLFLPENTSSYTVYLINDTNFSLTAHCEMTNSQSAAGLMLKIVLPPYHFEPIGELKATDMGQHPVLMVKIPSHSIDYHYRFKPKSLGAAPQRISLCQEALLVWKITDKIGGRQEKKEDKAVDLQHYTQNFLKWRQEENALFVRKNEVERFAHFPIELDLHIEKLVPNFDKVKPQNILSIQLNHFEEYLCEALSLRVPKVYIIHGKGDGILREAIHKRLRTDYEGRVLRFNNDFHSKYGNGATEIILREG